MNHEKAGRAALALAWVLGLMVSVPALAASPASGAASGSASAAAAKVPSSPAKKALVAKVLNLQREGFEGMGRSLAEQPLQRLIQAAGQLIQQQPADKREALAKSVDAEIRKYLDDAGGVLRDRANKLAPSVMGPMLEDKFSEDELRQLVTWLESPTYRKYQQAAPEMRQAFAEKLVDDSRGAIEPKLKSLQDRIATILGVPPRQGAASAPAASAGSAAKP